MDNTIRGSLIINEAQPDGTLLLPGCELVLTYERSGGRTDDSSSDTGKMDLGGMGSNRSNAARELEKIKEKLLPVLENIDWMFSLKQQDISLLQARLLRVNSKRSTMNILNLDQRRNLLRDLSSH